MTKGLIVGFFALMGMAVPGTAAPFAVGGIEVGWSATLVDAPVPRAHPRRQVTAPAALAQTAPVATTAGDWAGLPQARPGKGDLPPIVGRVENGHAVLSPTAFAARNDGAAATLFEAAEAAATGAPVVPPATARLAPPPVDRGLSAIARPDPRAFAAYGKRSSSLKTALDAVKADRYKDAIALRNGLSDPHDRLIVDYFIVRAYPPELTYAMVADYASRARGWPSPDMVHARAEATLARETHSPDQVIAALGGKAETEIGLRLLARAYLAKGDRSRASALVRGVWQDERMGTGLQKVFVAEFGSLLTADDHLNRAEELIGDGYLSEARDLRVRLGNGPRAYVDALVAAASGAGDASARLKGVPADLRRRSGYKLATAEVLRRDDEIVAAAKLLESADPREVVNGDAWWVESRIVSRSLAEQGDWRRAYNLAAKGFARSAEDKADEAFHAGWFALVGLKDGARADRHFAALAAIATTPLTTSRAAYWRGRAAIAAGRQPAARQFYGAAAEYGFTYYGQLARTAIGRNGTGVARAPQPSAADRAAIRQNPAAQAVVKLVASGHEHRIWPFLEYLAETVPTAGQAVLISEMGETAGMPHLALMAAKDAQRRGLPVGLLAYPTKHIPKTATVPAGLDKAVVFAIARQESLFNTGARSPVGAAGLMQVMPVTAASMARELGLKHSDARLINDPAYNATLGAAYLKKRLGNFDGSYILTFAAYNAGAGRVREWIERFGDPRRPDIDPVLWVEQIPYPETRNYVQRVMENVQVYREALGTGHLAIDTDLNRGRPS